MATDVTFLNVQLKQVNFNEDSE